MNCRYSNRCGVPPPAGARLDLPCFSEERQHSCLSRCRFCDHRAGYESGSCANAACCVWNDAERKASLLATQSTLRSNSCGRDRQEMHGANDEHQPDRHCTGMRTFATRRCLCAASGRTASQFEPVQVRRSRDLVSGQRESRVDLHAHEFSRPRMPDRVDRCRVPAAVASSNPAERRAHVYASRSFGRLVRTGCWIRLQLSRKGRLSPRD